MKIQAIQPEPMETWDPLDTGDSDPEIVIAAQRREIRNILKSYTGYYDLFSELLQNALDAVERRALEDTASDYSPKIWLTVDMKQNSVSITDNGLGMELGQFKQFLKPSLSFKQGTNSRGCKGVGATYLGYGFNHLEVATKFEGKSYSGLLRRGREWVEDRTNSVLRPKFEYSIPSHAPFNIIDRGTSVTVQLIGKDIRPKNLGWVGATAAENWLAVLRATTPLGGIYLCSEKAPKVQIELEVVHPTTSERTKATINEPRYLYPQEVIKNTADLRDFLADQKKRIANGQDVSSPPARFRKLNGLWGEWPIKEILDNKSDCPIKPRLDEDEQNLARELSIRLYIFLAYSTDLWDYFNDKQLGLRANNRLLRGGLQLATQNMPQGLPLTIPMTNNIGYQNMAHVVIHFENAEPDLGRKGFQPNQVRVAEKLSVSAVTAFRRRYNMLRKPGGAKEFDDELKLSDWIKKQEQHETQFPLEVTGTGLFMPQERLAISSEPIVEQDVVALFNQMLSSGLVRGVQLISSSQYKQYDGLFRIKMDPPFERFILSDLNPLGVNEELFNGREKVETVVKVLEYKYTLDGLIEEIQGEIKNAGDIGLAVVWDIGTRWKQMFDTISYLDPDNTHHRRIHGTTHSFIHSMSGVPVFEAVILKDLINYLQNPTKERKRQQEIYSAERWD
ncbi:MAG: ATP-binding protein [Blastocatellia bacterium]